jgi:hypothetical protein
VYTPLYNNCRSTGADASYYQVGAQGIRCGKQFHPNDTPLQVDISRHEWWGMKQEECAVKIIGTLFLKKGLAEINPSG